MPDLSHELEICSKRDGAWYEVDLVRTRVVEWMGRTLLRVRLSGWGEHEDELLEESELFTDRLRLAGRVAREQDVGLLVPGKRVFGFAKSRTSEDQKWFDAQIVEVRMHHCEDSEVGFSYKCRVEWIMGEVRQPFGPPKENWLSLQNGDIYIPGKLNPKTHPSLVKWLKCMQEVQQCTRKSRRRPVVGELVPPARLVDFVAVENNEKCVRMGKQESVRTEGGGGKRGKRDRNAGNGQCKSELDCQEDDVGGVVECMEGSRKKGRVKHEVTTLRDSSSVSTDFGRHDIAGLMLLAQLVENESFLTVK